MKKINKMAMLLATAAIAGSAFATGSTTNSDNWRSNVGNLQWKNGDGSLCWRDNVWTPATAAPGCDGAIVPVVAKPAPAPAPVVAAPVVAPKPAAPAPVAKPAPAPAPVVAPAPKRKAKQDRN
jgi:OmpA-OmpF porin, OOP family